jgi:hypothetical protein
MTRLLVRTAILSIALATLAAVLAAAEKKEYKEKGKGREKEIEEGVDYWRTPASGTMFTFPAGDVETLCHKPPDPSWNHQVSLKGVPTKGADWDSAVARLTDAEFDKTGTAHTKVQFKSLALASTTPTDTPCGKLNWTARLAKGKQPITPMKITLAPDGKGGVFSAELALKVEMQATAVTGASVGRLFYDIKLPDPAGGTPWSFGANNAFRPGMDANNNCIQVLRDKLGTFPPGSQHIYFVSNLIAKGQCKERPQ